jgi:hypothetical protein
MPRKALAALVLLTAAACRGNEPDGPRLGPAPVIALVSGGGQVVEVGSEFGTPVKVRLTTAAGTPMERRYVAFDFSQPFPGTNTPLAAASILTDEAGVAEVKFTVTRVGAFTVTAYYPECVEPGFKFCERYVTRAAVTVDGTGVEPSG